MKDMNDESAMNDSQTKPLSYNDASVDKETFSSMKTHSYNGNGTNGTSTPPTAPVVTTNNHSNQQRQQYTNGRPRSSSSPSLLGRIILSILRILLMDVPLLLVLSLYVSIIYLEWLSINYLIPLNKLQIFDNPERDITYYHRICTSNDQTTNDTIDLLVDITGTTGGTTSTSTDTNKDDVIDIAVEKMLKHGVTIIPNLLSEQTAATLREYILEENKKDEHLIFVIENKFRWSFPIQVDQHPIINIALQEILYQPNLRQYIEAVMGYDPAVIEFTAITQAYGAKEQFWHQDVVPAGNAAKYGRKFIPSYSLFIPLQNVTAEMGATGICPGTHMCSELLDDFCKDTGFQASGSHNNWPLGYGAFVNQQTTHRGAAHRDPNGPHRVLFILTFAPKPQTYQPYRVESRLIGMAGSYSLHWSQWGHTLSDFQQPLKYMTQPYRTLRNLGIYNSRGNTWGWDYITVSSGRIANEDTGFTGGDLHEFLSSGGFPWLPKYLQGNYTTQDDETSDYGWIPYLQDTISKCKVATTKAYYTAAFLYVGFIMLFAITSSRQHRNRFVDFTTNVFRLLSMHIFVLVIAWLIQQRVVNSTWGRNIKGERSFRVSSDRLTLAPSLPATLPDDGDIFIFEGMQSESLSSYTRVLEVFHPGNREWNDLVSHFAPSYNQMSPALQDTIRNQILHIINQESRCILIQSADFNWASTTQEIRHTFVHKSLLQRSSRLMNHVLQTLDNLLSEVRYGYWRDTSLHQKHISRLIYGLREQIMHRIPLRRRVLKKLLVPINNIKSFVFDLHGVTPCNVTTVPNRLRNRNDGIPTGVAPNDSLPSTWLNVGDIAEASYGDDTTEWYRCTITYASSNRVVWDVLYDDGEEWSELCRTCVRPFVPYAINETIDVRTEPDYYSPGHVTAIRKLMNSKNVELVYDIQLHDDDSETILPNVHTKDLRRTTRTSGSELPTLPLQTRVRAMYRDDDGNKVNFFPGKIIQYHSAQDTYDILYDDGDISYNVQRHDIELLS